MIRIVQNDNVLVLSPAEIMQREAIKQRTSITNAVNTVFSNNNIHSNNNGSSTMIWQSVPRHKSMVHSVPQSLDQVSCSKSREELFRQFWELECDFQLPKSGSWSRLLLPTVGVEAEAWLGALKMRN